MSGIPIVPPLAALVLFAIWTMALVLAIGAWRIGEVLSGRKKPQAFTPGAPHGTDAYWRLNRAHLNATENLPVFGALVLAGLYLQVPDTAFQILPSLVLYARLTQTIIHVASGSTVAVTLRLLAFAVQVVSMFAIAAVVLPATGVPMPW